MDELLAEIAASGWLFNNCYQVDSALWRVSLRRPEGNGDWLSDWAEGPTLAEALHACMAKLADAEWEEEHKSLAVKGLVADHTIGTSLLARLGIAKLKPQIIRKI